MEDFEVTSESSAELKPEAHPIISVAFDGERYNISAGQNTSWAEIAFAFNVVARIFERENIVTRKEFVAKLNQYLTDEQWDEVTDEPEPPLPEVEDLDNDVLAEADDD